MYVLPAPILPCYSVMLPLHFVCKLFDLNPNNLPSMFVRDIRHTRWRYLTKTFDVSHVIRMTDNISIFNRRDPVIQEGGVESIEMIFVYDNRDADVQYNNTLNCKNKNEDYDGDTNTLSIGKGYESRVEIHYNMSTQMMFLLRNRHVFSQNFLSRFMLRLAFDDVDSFNRLENACSTSIGDLTSPRDLVFELIRRVDTIIDRLNYLSSDDVDGDDNEDNDDNDDNVPTKRAYRDVDNSAARARKRISSVFPNEKYARIYMFYLAMNLRAIKRKRLLFVAALETYLGSRRRIFSNDITAPTLTRDNVENFNDDSHVDDDDDQELVSLALEYLYETEKVWQPSRFSHSSNCYSIVDNVIRSVYVAYGERECTDLIDSLVRTTHENVVYYFMGNNPFSFACIVNVLSQAKGNFDALINMQKNLNVRFHRPPLSIAANPVCESVSSLSSSLPMAVAGLDILSRVTREKIQHNQSYVDNFVEGSKKIPKYCKLAIAMKWALQNLYYYDGNLLMDGEIAVEDVTSYFSIELFTDINLVLAVLADEL